MMPSALNRSRYTVRTKTGFRILQIYYMWGSYYVIATNGNGEYVWGRNYDLANGYWMGGDYRRRLEELKPLIMGKLVIDNASMGDLRK